ncbi:MULTISPECIES: hypothetical protein [Geobacillus]|uniref:Uncharacterized protein n=1 Tax=Geobacillus thermopakistaniensis (strain MAS1) TaxID=1408282 RepID=A0A7U9JAW2_GEOTM|nr:MULTISPECIES: hypothetical protein [Geobacillus]ESU72082.1 hypothetical protein T260_10045 [Geobacillus sp. MAS1]MBW7643388.1 hypothetical protein [Geobacillus thermoleovorans]MED4971567.1 hypothetical protein [Geobacillus thermoleovorans]UPT59800.1 hypothetical protein GK107_10430 [Geobacillus thermoleovorans]WMJ18831.1 hypothetical protein RA957_11370 [Geobacillus kaustophilus]
MSEWKEKGGFVWRKAAFSASVGAADCRLAPGGCAEGRWGGQHRFALLWLVVAVTPTERYNSE